MEGDFDDDDDIPTISSSSPIPPPPTTPLWERLYDRRRTVILGCSVGPAILLFISMLCSVLQLAFPATLAATVFSLILQLVAFLGLFFLLYTGWRAHWWTVAGE